MEIYVRNSTERINVHQSRLSTYCFIVHCAVDINPQ